MIRQSAEFARTPVRLPDGRTVRTNGKEQVVSRMRGFTLIELMITVVVLVILTTIAAPSFSEWLARVRITGQANSLVGDLSLARSESATRGAAMSVCVRKDDTTCDTDAKGHWESGWLVFVDVDGDGDIKEGTDTIVRVGGELGGNTKLLIDGFGSDGFVQFRPYGGLNPPTAGTFSFCSETITPNGVDVSIAATGRAKASKVTSCK
jgi:type IV fimbrial biogenesis protein FimT